MRKLFPFLVATAVAVSACGKKDAPAPAEKAPAKVDGKAIEKAAVAAAEKAAPEAVATLESFLKDENASLTPELLEQFMLATAPCQLKDDSPDYTCEQLKQYRESRGRKTALKDMAGMYAGLGAKHIGHEAPVVRILAAEMMSSVFGTADSSRKALVAAAEKEQVPGVLAAFLGVLANSVGKDDEAHNLLMKFWDHPSKKVRTVLMSAYTSSWSKGRADGFSKILEKLEKEPEMRLKEIACQHLAGPGDARAEEALEKYLKAKDTPEELFTACWRGAIAGWGGVIKPDAPSKKLYELSVSILEAKPRTQKRPPWTAISDFSYLKSFTKPENSFDKTWKEKVQDYVKPERIIKALTELVTDESVYWMARTSAIDTLERNDVPDATLQGFADKYKDETGDNMHVKSAAMGALKRRAERKK